MIDLLRLPTVLSLCVMLAGGVACRNTIVERLGDAGPADGGALGPDGGGGEGEGEGECPQADAPALVVQVIDDATDFTLCETVTVVVSDSDFTETAVTSGAGEQCRHIAARGRPGTYTVAARGTGFRDASLDDLSVAADDCGDPLVTRQVTLTLGPP
ncbi:MAG: carboxypeptidase regulatory-like domain-containing protein [Deltaproteobacteria bacterium]|nr:carboxypeptidase regulatory-like domain-containing protein [Deltaproteobacteria bacterium]